MLNFSNISKTTLPGKALRLPLRLIPDTMQMRILQGPLRGHKWIAGSSVPGCWLGNYEHPKPEAFSGAIKRGHVVYDIGSNVGFYSLLASGLVGPEGRVFSFEPVPRNLTFLRTHLKVNKIENCMVLDVAVTRSAGTANFDLGPHSSMGHLTDKPQNTLTVRTVALSDLVASGELPLPNVIKCDIEGGEYDALIGAANILSTHAPTIFLATHGPEVHERCCRLLTEFHYKLISLDELPVEKTSEILAIPKQS